MSFFCLNSYALNINVRVDVDANRLLADTKSIQVICILSDEVSAPKTGHVNISVKDARITKSVDVPIIIDQDIIDYKRISCELRMCKTDSPQFECPRPISKLQSDNASKNYYTYNEEAYHKISSEQGMGEVLIKMIPVIVDVDEPAVIPPEEIPNVFQPKLFTVTPLIATGLSNELFQAKIIDVPEMTGTGSYFEPKIFIVPPLLATGISNISFQPEIINVISMTGAGTASEALSFTVAPLIATGISSLSFSEKIINITPMTGVGTALKAISFNVTPLVATGISSLSFSEKIINITPMTGVGIALEVISFNVTPLVATGINSQSFPEKTINVTPMTGVGIAFKTTPLLETDINKIPFQQRPINLMPMTGKDTGKRYR